MQIELLKTLFENHKESSLSGRYIHNQSLQKYLEKLCPKIELETVGKSVENRDIISLTIGKGLKKILMWSQMHGNESTTTKAVFDLMNVLVSDSKISEVILEKCQIKVIPILNPDGAFSYTRVNANKIDLNRDAQRIIPARK